MQRVAEIDKMKKQELRSRGGKEAAGRRYFYRMNKCKITVLQCRLNEELVKEYGAPGLTLCPMMKEGQEFLVDYDMPEGFCNMAWRSIYPNIFALSHGQKGSPVKYLDWVNREGLAIVSCNDALRPVYFKIEVTDIPSDYVPVSSAPEEPEANKKENSASANCVLQES